MHSFYNAAKKVTFNFRGNGVDGLLNKSVD